MAENQAQTLYGNTVRPLYPRFLKPKLSTPNFYQLQSDLYYSPSDIREPRLSTVFEDKIQYAQVPRIIEVWLYF